MLFVFALSITSFFTKSLRLDEAQSIFQTNGSMWGTIKLVVVDVHLPLYFVLLHIWEMFFGMSVTSLRSMSLLFLLASIPAFYYLGKEAYGKKVGLLLVGFAALSPFLNWFGAETRMYTLLLLVTILNQLFFLRLWKRNHTHNRAYAWIFYGLTVVFGVYTHYFFSFILFVQAIFYLIHKKTFPAKSFRYFAIVATLAAGLLGAWFYLRMITGTNDSDPHLVAPSSVDVFNVFSNFFIGFQGNTFNTIFLSLWPLAIFGSFALLSKHTTLAKQTIYFLMNVFIPIALAFIISATIRPLFLSRYLTIILPSIYILIIHYVTLYPKKMQTYVIAGLCVVLSASLFAQAFSETAPSNENFREASAYVSAVAEPQDLFVLSAPFITYPIEYYYQGQARLSTFPIWNRYEESKQIPEYSEESLISATDEWSKTYSKMYVLMGYDQGYEEQMRLYLDKNFERTEARQFSPGLNLYVYKLRYL